ncbi:hypothetical protein C8F04DRAFT_1221292 [Mycena alexandri]|uniref:Uncharacterized protein n=1 Tax=Mycena alexandri TaxID=1745969 RepID=A0AAD6SX28_9AGAR|nr:hypothetical protein C8F04DRAFT_1221292 [Mycena alexandri]
MEFTRQEFMFPTCLGEGKLGTIAKGNRRGGRSTYGIDLSNKYRLLWRDTASPVLWNIYFADLADVFEPDSHDIRLNEQADDVALFSTTAAGLQRKLDQFYGCVLKTEWMLFGELPRTLPLVKKYKFVGLIFTSVSGDIFAAHYSKKASKARAVANTMFAAKSMIDIRLYMARMDPHLTFGCEISLDVHQFLRRLLGLHRRSILAVLFSETGVVPLAYRRPIIALGYLIYLITLPENHFATAAYLDSILLARSGHPCWFSDLRFVLQKLPVPVQLSLGDLTADGVADIRKALEAACEKWIGETIADMSPRLPLIQGRLECNAESALVPTAAKFRQYLRIPVPAHRKALTRLVLSAHTLSVEILRLRRTVPETHTARV